MNVRTEFANRLAAYPDELYLRRDEAATAGLAIKALAAGLQGLVLGAPRSIDTDRHDALPALLLTGRNARRAARLEWERNAVLLASDLERGPVFAAEAFQGNPDKSPDDAPRGEPELAPAAEPQDDPLGAGNTAGTAWFDFRALLELPWRSGRLALRVIEFDTASNPVLVSLSSKAASAAELPAAQAIDLVRRLREVGQSAHRLPAFFRSPKTPPLAAPGVALALDVAEGRAGAGPLPVHGSIRLEVPRAMIVEPAAIDLARPRAERPPSAVIGAMVLVLKENRPAPIQIPLQIPVWVEAQLHPGVAVEAAFSIDLAVALPELVLPGHYQVYLAAGPYLSAPQALRLQ